ncbi:unnamed protein product [Brassica napus]|uniref:(rape) hypothetical protein n=2 Tax=Brassica napus TaxID=3708 RepID=A0A816W5B7_BRANA|nr:unnamed protein product [Brassica napus]
MGIIDQKIKKGEEHLMISKPLRLILFQSGRHVLRSLFFVTGFLIGVFLYLQLKAFHMSTPKTEQPLWSTVLFHHSTMMEIKQVLQTQELQHDMSDQELFTKVSSLSSPSSSPSSSSWFGRMHNNDEKMVVKVAFMFMTGGALPLAALWDKFFKGHEGFYSIYVHTNPSFQDSYPETSVFYSRRIPSQPVYWGTSSMVDAEKRLLANALLDESNQRFVLLSDSCIPLFDFTTIYDYLTGTNLSFIGSFDDPRKSGRGRYNPKMYPQINVTHWRKGSQWFSTTRELALHILADTFYYKIFDQHCKPPCYMDEHYIPTLIHMFHGEMSANRTLTWVDWSRVGPHPGRFIWPDITDEFLNRIRFTEECAYYSRDGENTTTSKCFLFARKFTEDTLEPLLRIYPLVLGSEHSKVQTLLMLTPLFVSVRPLPSLTTISSLNPNQNPPHTSKAPNFNQFNENPKLPDNAIKVPTAPWMKGPIFLPPDELINTSHHHKSTRKQNAEEKTFKALNRRESGVRGSKAMKKIVRSVEKLDDSEGEFKSLEEAETRRRRRMPWEREEEKFILRRRKKERVLTTADLILDEGLLKRLRLEASKMREWVNVRKAGVTETVVNDIRLIWEENELAMVRFDVPLCRNMERAQEILELKTGGLVVLSKKEFLVVYRGPLSDSSVCVKEGGDDISSSLYEREGERLLNGLGPRYVDWWMRRPFPVDADLLPEVVDGYRTPSRRCPPNTRAKLSDKELTYLRNIAQALPFHFVLGRNHGLQGLASAILKLWEKCVIAKIAIKWGALNTNNEEMADELKNLTGGVLILRNKYLIILFRGKDFLSDEVADLVDDRERLLRRYQHFEETRRESDIEISEVVADGEQLEETSKTGTLLEFQELQRKFGDMEVRNLETEAEKAKLEKELKSQEHKLCILKSKIEKTTIELLKLNSLRKPSERDDDIEILTNEERECLRRIGLKMNSSLVLGRRGVFDGVMEGLHQHWKHREVAKVITMQKLFSRVVYTAKSLEAESNGVLISIEKLKEGHAILMYRGRNYKRPSSKLMAQNLLTKRKALQRSVLMQRLGSLKFFAYQRERAIEDLKLSLVKLQGSASELC